MIDNTRAKLLDAAGQLFATQGFEATSIREICDKAEANVASVNYYFGDKQRLYIEAVSEAQCARVEQVPMPEWAPGTPASQRLRDFVRTFLRRLLWEERPAWHLELMLRELAHPTAACAHVVEDYIRPVASILEQIVAELLPPGTAQSDAYLVGFSVVGQCLFYHVHRPIASQLMGAAEFNALTIDRLADHITDFTLAALGCRPPILGGTEALR
jgi:AcrR family transcriptional regulator